MNSIWLFRFISYRYCQGTRDTYEDIRLLTFTMPCGIDEAKMYLINELHRANLEFSMQSIEVLNYRIINS